MLRAVIAILLLLVPSVAQAEGRFALLIGNEAYGSEIGRLSNPHNDVAVLEHALKSLGFEVAADVNQPMEPVDAQAEEAEEAAQRPEPFAYIIRA